MRNTSLIALFSMIFLGFLTGCNLPVGTPGASATLKAVYTSQAATIEVLETRSAMNNPGTPVQTLPVPTGISTQVPSVTETSGPVAPTQAADTPLPQPSWTALPSLTPFPSVTPMVVHTVTMAPSLTLLATVKPSATALPKTYCNWAAFVKDVSYPDGAVVDKGAQFVKTWRLKNIGTCTWKKSYGLVFLDGDNMNGVATTTMPYSVAPGQTVDLSVLLTAPTTTGNHTGYWVLRDDDGNIFGIGDTASKPFYVEIKVINGFDTKLSFTDDYCDATWRSAAGVLPCPGDPASGDGLVKRVKNPKLEDGQIFNSYGLYVMPQQTSKGYIRGIYPAVKVAKGDHFRSIVTCAYNADGCNATFRLDYQVGSGSVKNLWEFSEAYDGMYYSVDIKLDSLAGKSVKFILTLLSDGKPQYDKLIWIDPRVENP